MMCRITLCYVLLAYLLTYSAAESPDISSAAERHNLQNFIVGCLYCESAVQPTMKCNMSSHKTNASDDDYYVNLC